jgi:hypothetical protein
VTTLQITEVCTADAAGCVTQEAEETLGALLTWGYTIEDDPYTGKSSHITAWPTTKELRFTGMALAMPCVVTVPADLFVHHHALTVEGGALLVLQSCEGDGRENHYTAIYRVESV